MKNSARKIWNHLHILIAGIVSVVAIYLLTQEIIIGWLFQSLAGFLYAWYFWKHKLPIMTIVILGAEALLPIYGIYKWMKGIRTFTFIDAVIFVITFTFILYIGYIMFRDNKQKFLFVFLEFVNALMYIVATLILALTQSVIAWILFALSYALTFILVAYKKEWIAILFQIIYVILAMIAIVESLSLSI